MSSNFCSTRSREFGWEKETENKNNQGTGEKLNSRLENAVGRRPARYVLEEGTKNRNLYQWKNNSENFDLLEEV